MFRQQQQQQASTTTTVTMKIQHTWIADLPRGTFLANSCNAIRVMGVLVDIGYIPDHDLPHVPSLMMLPTGAIDEDVIQYHYRRGQQQQQQQQRQRHQGSTVSTTTTTTTTSDDSSHRRMSAMPQLRTLTIDDGTDTVTFWVESQMIESTIGAESSTTSTTIPSISDLPLSAKTTTTTSLAVELGKTYDCILKLRQSASIRRWFADTLILVTDPIDEHLRWIQLSHHCDGVVQVNSQQHHHHRHTHLGSSKDDTSSCTTPILHLNHTYGYPTRKRDTSEVYRLICVQAKLSSASVQRKTRQQHNQRGDYSHPRWRVRRPVSSHPQRTTMTVGGGTTTGTTITPPPLVTTSSSSSSALSSSSSSTAGVVIEGAQLDDLALVLRMPVKRVQDILLDLQLQGQVYQNGKGEYLPL